LRAHSCAYFLEPLLQHLDRQQFELYLYHDHFRVDAVSLRLQAQAAVWRNLVGQPGPAVEQIIRADAPDILIDLAGHTGMNNRLALFARRLAPVQVTYLGYPNTTGLPAMDYRFTDAVADPVGEADRFATERLVRFAPTAWTYAAPPDAPAVNVRPSSPDTPVTFGCFNNLAKLTDAMLAAWAKVLHGVPGSRLWLKGSGLGDRATRAGYLERFARLGLPAERITLLDRTAETASHLAMYHEVDVALDTFPYHGTTTTCEALWMGVPVVTLAGDRHMSRVGASLLTAIGHAEWIAASADDYVRIATDLALDRGRLGAIRAGLRQEITRSPLGDHRAQADLFGAALRSCWKKWCTQATTPARAAGDSSTLAA
jgi:protein O-GlcNAc transferase